MENLAGEEEKWEALRQRQRWSRRDAEWVVAEWAKSDESVSGFARRHGFKENRLYDWQTRLKREAQKVELVPVTVRGGIEGEACRSAVVVTTHGVRIEVNELSTASREWIRQLFGIGSGS